MQKKQVLFTSFFVVLSLLLFCSSWPAFTEAQITETELRQGDIAKTGLPDWQATTSYASLQLVLHEDLVYRRTSV